MQNHLKKVKSEVRLQFYSMASSQTAGLTPTGKSGLAPDLFRTAHLGSAEIKDRILEKPWTSLLMHIFN